MDDHARRQSWFGLKRFVKRFLALRVPNAILWLVSKVAPPLRAGRLPAPSRLTEVSGRVGGVTFVLLDPARCENAKELFWGRSRRPNPHDRLALDTVAALAGGSDTFLDVGAYTGLFTMAVTAFAPHVDVHAFEIVPAVADALKANARRNGVDDRVVVHREGIGDPNKTMRVPSGEGGSALPSSTRRGCGSTEAQKSTSDRWIPSPPDPGSGPRRDEGRRGGNGGHDVADGAALDGLLAGARLHKYLVTEPARPHRSRRAAPGVRDWLFTSLTEEELRGLELPVG